MNGEALVVLGVVGWLVVSTGMGWALFQPPRGSVHGEQMSLWELCQMGLLWPVWVLILVMAYICEKRRL